MLSRRAFLVGGLASGLAVTFDPFDATPSWAKKRAAEIVSGPHVLAKDEWPPPIAPSQVGVTDKSLCCFTDEFGRLALMDFRAKKGKPVQLLGKLSGLGRKVLDFRVSGNKAYALVSAEAESGDSQLMLIGITLLTTPQIVSRTVLDKFTDVTSVAASPQFVCVGGTSTNGDPTVAIYTEARSGRASEPAYQANYQVAGPVVKLEISNRTLVALVGQQNSTLQCLSIAVPSAPELHKSLSLGGDFTNMSAFGDIVLLAGSFEWEGKTSGSESYVAVKSVALTPVPHVVSQMQIDPLVSVADMAATRGRFMVLGNTSSDMTVVSMTVTKLGVLSRDRDNDPPRLGSPIGQSCRLALRDKTAYVASGWIGLKIVSLTLTGWKTTYEYTVPRYAASSIAAWKNWVVLAGPDLRLYDISQASAPHLVSTTNLPAYSKNVVGAGSFLVCLLKDTLTLRKMQNLNEVAASLQLTGNELCFDAIQQKVYVLQTLALKEADAPLLETVEEGGKGKFKDSEQAKQVKLERQKKHAKDAKAAKETRLVKIQAYSNSLVNEQTFTIPGVFTQASAHDGVVLMSGLNDVSLFDVTKSEPDLIGSHHFENLALRQGVVTKDHILLTAVDSRSKGFFLVLSRSEKDLRVMGSTELPNDARGLAASKGKAVIIGQQDGKDSAVIVDYRSEAAPKVVASVPGVEEAAAVTISDESAILCGRGIEIVSLS
jgi:hypothetical protein